MSFHIGKTFYLKKLNFAMYGILASLNYVESTFFVSYPLFYFCHEILIFLFSKS